LAGRRFNGDLVVEQPADRLDNREAEADPPALIVTRIIDLVEGIEQSI
jgi:hypothetical protein